jgi:hypothetical protein
LGGRFSWKWCHDNLIHLDLIPYHSRTVNGLRINDFDHYRTRYFEVILRLLRYLSPSQPIFINGFPTVKALLSDQKEKALAADFRSLLEFEEGSRVWRGQIDKRFDFYGLPFLTRVTGGKDELVKRLKQFEPPQRIVS